MNETSNVTLLEQSPPENTDSQTQMTDYFGGSELIWLLLPVIVFVSSTYSGQKPRMIKNNGSKLNLVCSGCIYLILCTRISIKLYPYLLGHNVEIIHLLEPMTLAIFMILADNMDNYGSYSKGMLCIVWLGLIAKHTSTIYSESKGIIHKDVVDQIDFAATCAVLVELLVRLISSFVPDKDRSTKDSDDETEGTPEENASLLSKLTFSWMNGLMKQGYSKTLKNSDLYQLARERTADDAFTYFKPFWDKEYSKVKSDTVANFTNERKKSENQEKSKRAEASVLRAVLFAFYPLIAYTIFLELVIKSLHFTYPVILKRMIQTVEDENSALWKGAAYAIAMFCLNMTSTLVGNHLGHHNIHFEYRLKGALMSCIYKKMLRMSHAARKSSTVGEIVNLMSVDSGRFVTMVHWINNIWLCPLQVIIAMCFLWTEMGASAIAGFLTIAVFLPAHTILAKKTKVLHEQLSDTKDSRIKLMNEILNGIKVMKLYTWEESFEKKVQVIREKEISLMRKIKIWDSISTLIWHIGPFLVSLSTFALYILGDDSHLLTAEKAFVSISIFHTLSWAMSAIPHTINGINMGFVSLKRIRTFLNNEELDDDVITRGIENDSAISVNDATFSWDKKEAPILKDITLEITEGSLVAIVGSVGAGKSSLLSAFLGEMSKASGTVNIKGSTAYIAQQAWIQNGTLKNNILFGRSNDQGLYNKVVDACALIPDIEILPGGNMAEIGEKGVNLSVGQKQRVNLARAVYQDCDIYLFDDPLSAVDSHVGKHIFDNVIGPNGILKNKTRVLVTHGIHFLPKVDKIITLDNGFISEVGSYEELKTNSGSFSQFLKTYMKNDGSINSDSEEEDNINPIDNKSEKEADQTQHLKKANDDDSKVVGEEDVETGEVKFAHLMSYILSVGMYLCVFIFLSYVVYQSTDVYSTYWLSEWTTDVGKTVTMHANDNTTYHDNQRYYRLAGYGIFGLFKATLAFLQALLVFLGGLVASRTLHQKLLRNVLASPMSFFETNPVGRIVTRFSKDIETIDWLSHELKEYSECLTKMIMIPIVIGYNIPWFLVVLLPVFFIFKSLQKFHNPTTRQLKRLESANKSPMYTHFSESINGVSTIRAYQEQDRFASESRQRIDAYHKSLFSLINVHRWVGIRVELIAISLDLIAALLAILSRDVLSTGIIALCITYTMDATGTLNWFMHCSLNTEEKLISVERINEYMEKPTEAAWTIEEKKPNVAWPATGKVTFKNYQTKYRDELDLVLKGISCDINPGEKVGIVGRTGAGKSSLTMALFRIIESTTGSIIIDDVDISTIGLHDLRSKLTIIPQDPVIFSGTLRMNLDPFEHYSDDELWKALEHSHLSKFVASLPNKLQHECSEGGENLSVGQRQLLCLARALLKKTKILILDEATAAVDLETDELIQKTIRTQFSDCTILTIAHRLNTIMDYTRVMVLSSGKIQEFDTPRNLLSNTKSVFYGMAKDANLV